MSQILSSWYATTHYEVIYTDTQKTTGLPSRK